METLRKNIKMLSCAIAPSGFESNVMKLWTDLIHPYVSRIEKCTLGDSVAIKTGRGSKSLLITAHADEVGIIITRIDKDSRLAYFDEIGGIDTSLLVGRMVRVINNLNGDVYGVIGCQPIHCQKYNKDQNTRIRTEDLFIDLGDNIDSVEVGDYGVIDPSFIENGNFISGKAMDNRVGLAIMIEVAKKLESYSLDGNIFFVATTMEEIGARGIRPVINKYNPSQCIVIDVAIATDTPFHTKTNSSSIKLGHGVVITIGPNLDKYITKGLQSISEKLDLDVQLDVCSHPTGTDANPVQIMQQGIPCGLIGIPCRYMHSPIETINLKDVNQSIELLVNYIINFLN